MKRVRRSSAASWGDIHHKDTKNTKKTKPNRKRLPLPLFQRLAASEPARPVSNLLPNEFHDRRLELELVFRQQAHLSLTRGLSTSHKLTLTNQGQVSYEP